MVTDVQSSVEELRGLPATQRLAESVAAVLRPGDVLGLDGDLGAGKTTFVRFLARALGVTTPVTSPTFTLANTYEAGSTGIPVDRRSGEGRNPGSGDRPPDAGADTAFPPAGPSLLIHHIDAYRLDGDADAEDLALPELLDSGGIVVVEWAERLTLPDDRLDLHFAFPPEPSAAPPTPGPEPPEPSAAGAVPPGPSAEPPATDGALPDPSAETSGPGAAPSDPSAETSGPSAVPSGPGPEPPGPEPPGPGAAPSGPGAVPPDPGAVPPATGAALPVPGAVPPATGAALPVPGAVPPATGAALPVPGAVPPATGAALPVPGAETSGPGAIPPDPGAETSGPGPEPPDLGAALPDTTDHRIVTIVPRGSRWPTRFPNPPLQ